MDWNDTLVWLVSLSAGLLGFRVLAQRPRPRGWMVVLGLIVANLIIGRQWYPHNVGYVSLGLWLLLVLFPSMGRRYAFRQAIAQRPQRARRIARLASWLHPADGWPETITYLDAIAALQQGRDLEAQTLLTELRNSHTVLGRTALAMQVRYAADWWGYIAWVDAHPLREGLLADDNLCDVYLQALGETGQRERMLHELARSQTRPEQPASHPTTLLHVAALCGEVATVERLLIGPLQETPQDMADFWRETARQVQGLLATDDGRTGDVAANFQSLEVVPNQMVAEPARRRLERPLSPLSPLELDEAARQTLRDLHNEVAHESQFAVMSSTPHRRAVTTLVIATILCLNFLRELPGGSENQDNLIDLGAIVVPRSAGFGEWWQPLTAAFLHFGWAHFLMNLFGLLFLGTRLERAWGPWRTLGCYAAAVAVSMTVTPWLLERTTTEPQMLAGASGGIMGLLGGLLGHLTVGSLRRRTPLVTRQLTLMAGFVLLQSLFDMTHEQVSGQAHLLGLGTGFVFGLICGALTPRSDARSC